MQGGVGQQAAGPQLLASVVPRPGQAAAIANLGLPGVGIPNSSGDSTAYFQQLLQGQQPANSAMLPSGAVLCCAALCCAVPCCAMLCAKLPISNGSNPETVCLVFFSTLCCHTVVRCHSASGCILDWLNGQGDYAALGYARSWQCPAAVSEGFGVLGYCWVSSGTISYYIAAKVQVGLFLQTGCATISCSQMSASTAYAQHLSSNSSAL